MSRQINPGPNSEPDLTPGRPHSSLHNPGTQAKGEGPQDHQDRDPEATLQDKDRRLYQVPNLLINSLGVIGKG